MTTERNKQQGEPGSRPPEERSSQPMGGASPCPKSTDGEHWMWPSRDKVGPYIECLYCHGQRAL